MSDTSSGRLPGPDAAEHLLDAAARAEAPATDPLSALLMAAAAPDHDRALAGEEAMLAEFRAAKQPVPKPGLRRRGIRAAAMAATAALSLSGMAIAADRAGLPIPLPILHRPSATAPGTPRPPSPTVPPRPEAGVTPGDSTSLPVPTSGRDSPSGRAHGRDEHTVSGKGTASGHGRTQAARATGHHRGRRTRKAPEPRRTDNRT